MSGRTAGPRTTCPGGQLVLGPRVREDSRSYDHVSGGTAGPRTMCTGNSWSTDNGFNATRKKSNDRV